MLSLHKFTYSRQETCYVCLCRLKRVKTNKLKKFRTEHTFLAAYLFTL